MKSIQKNLLLTTLITVNQIFAHPAPPLLQSQIKYAIQQLNESNQEEDAEYKILAYNLGATIFEPTINTDTKQSQSDLDKAIRLGFYFQKRSTFEHGEVALVEQSNNHITLGIIAGHLKDDGTLEIATCPTKSNRTDPEKQYIVILDKKGTWQKIPATKLGKILTNPRRWIIKKLIIKKRILRK